MKKKRLTDLYVTGCPFVHTDDKGNSVEVWLQKPSPIEHESAIRRANAARARMLMFRNDTDSEEWQSLYTEALDYGTRDDRIEYLVATDTLTRRQAVEAEVAAEEEWSKDNYLQGLYDSWRGLDDTPGLREEFAKDPESPEAKRVFEEMERFTSAVDAKVAPEVESLKRDYESDSDEEILTKVTNKFLESRADAAWLRELSRSELYFAIREPEDHRKRHFESRGELDLLPANLFTILNEAYRELVVPPAEVKALAGTEGSSPSSEPLAQEEVASPSGPLAVV